MMLQAGDLGLLLDTGTNRPGILQRFEDGDWRDFERDGEPVRWPCKVETLPPGGIGLGSEKPRPFLTGAVQYAISRRNAQ